MLENKKDILDKVVDLGLSIITETSVSTITYYYKGIEYYNKLIEDLEEHKPLFFQKKKINDYNTKLKEYNNELSKLYSKVKSEIKMLTEIQEML